MDDLVDRLYGRYSMGPHLPNGFPEFGIRQFETTPINREAAEHIIELRNEIIRLKEILHENMISY